MSPERVISIAISEADWKMLRTIRPEPIDWLKDTIRQTVEQARQAERREPSAPGPSMREPSTRETAKTMSAGR